MTNDQKLPVNALSKGFSIIELLSKKPDTLTSIAKKTDIPKSTLHRFLETLISLGIVEKSQYEEYSLTAKLFEYGAAALNAKELITVVSPLLYELQEKVKETAHFAIMSGANVTYLYKVESAYPIQLHSRVGYVAPAFSTSLGKAIMAWLPEKITDSIIQKTEYIPYTPNTIKNEVELRAQLNMIRQNGYSEDIEEHQENMICFGAPVFDYCPRVMAAISVSIPGFRYKQEQKDFIIQSLIETAREISAKFGCTNWPPDTDNFPVY